jgi:hypothetical protein
MLGNCFLHMDSIFTAEHVLSRMITPSQALTRITLYSRFLTAYRLYDSLLMQPDTISQFLTLDNPWLQFEFTTSR